MEDNELKTQIAKLSDKKDLLEFLNNLKIDQYKERAVPITMDVLDFCLNMDDEKRYSVFPIKKKSGGIREICAPRPLLMDIQNLLKEMFKVIYSPSSAANGFTEGRSIVTGANVHVGHNYVLNLDLSNFFPSISKSRVWKRLTLPPFNLSSKMSDLVASLCCIKDPSGNFDGNKPRYILPQGAPTSPILTNAICDTLDRRLIGLSRRFGLHYTRYADDMTFSSMHNVYKKDGDFMTELRSIVEGQGFILNEKKTRLQKKGNRQEVTGITVNEKVNVSKQYVRELRNILYIWKQYGYDEAFASFYKYYKIEKGYIKKGEPVML